MLGSYGRVCVLGLVALQCSPLASAFVADVRSCHRAANAPSRTSQLNVIGAETVGIALISAAAGAASRQPEINHLEGELATARKAVETSNEELTKKIEELEDKLFEMDLAYERESAKFQKDYEKKKAIEVARIEEKLKADMKFKLDIELEKEKSRLLAKKLKESNKLEESGELARIKIQQKQLEAAKEKLELALKQSEEKLELTKSTKGKSLWPF
eukprot:scaffold8740_cov113-Cylindrotheca_fusiformis.AAC.1